MFTNEQSRYLINLKKKIIENDSLLEKKTIQQKFPLQERFTLISREDDDFVFLLIINQSAKNQFKITLHHQEDEAKIGLVRVDFNGKHKNPEGILDTLPGIFHPYAGKWFEYHEPHIHYYVEGYSPLAWAIPLQADDFTVKNVANIDDIVNAVSAFGNKIHLQTALMFNKLIF